MNDGGFDNNKAVLSENNPNHPIIWPSIYKNGGSTNNRKPELFAHNPPWIDAAIN
jgi:hypothetical protein